MILNDYQLLDILDSFFNFFANLLVLFCDQFITLLMSSLQIQLQTKQKNRKKLIQQNLRLHAQLQKLQKEIEALDEHFNKKNVQQPHLYELRSQIQAQERHIKQIKELVEAGRQSNLKENIYYIKKEEDQLLWMKQELQNLLKEKDMVYQGHQDKLRKLAANQPLQKHKEQMQKSWADTKKQNRQISLKIVQMQREVRKLHNLKQRGKDKNAESSNQEVELATLQTQIARMSSQMKMKELKWKPNGQVLDNQFFTSRNNLHTLQKRLQQLQKQQGIWRVRSAALRDHSEIMTDRQRLSKIVTMPKPEAIIKPPTPKQATKQVARQPLFEAGFHKQVRDKIKNDKFVDLVRVSSTPAAMSNLKKQSLLAPIQTQILRKSPLNNDKISKQSPKSKKQNEKIIQVQPNLSKPKKNEASFKRQKSQKQKKQKQVLQQQKIDEQFEINKNGSNWLGRRDKIKYKQSNNAGLAQMIRQKAEQVKKMNKKMEEYEQRERSVSSPKKMRIKNEINRIQTQSQQNKEKHAKFNDKIDLSVQLSKKDKNQQIPKKPMVRQTDSVKKSASINQQFQTTNKKVLKSARNLRKIRQENLVQKLDMNSKINNFSVEKQSKVKILNKTPIQTPKKAESPKAVKEKQIKGQINQQKQEQSPKNKQKKPVFQIMITDNPRQNQMNRLETNNLPIVPPDDDTDGIPKIIVRKKANTNQVTTGTST